MADQNFFQSQTFKRTIFSLLGLTILVLVFCLGIFVGMQRAEFSFKWAEEYHRNFGGPQGGIFGNFIGQDGAFTESNGSFGQIIKLDLTAGIITIKDASNTEKNILVNNKTSIIYQRKNIKISDLKMNDSIVVIGDPDNNGQIQAELIRVIPSLLKTPPTNNNPQTTPPPQDSQQNNFN